MAKLTEAAATKLLGRLSRTGKFPEDREELKQMARALMEAAPDAELAGRVVDALRRTKQFCPCDADFYEVAATLQPSAPPSWPPPFKGIPICPLRECDGSGWKLIEVASVESVTKCRCFGMPREFQRVPAGKGNPEMQALVQETVAAVTVPPPPLKSPQSITPEQVEEARREWLESRKVAAE